MALPGGRRLRRGLELLGRLLEARGAVVAPAGAPGRALRVAPVRVLRQQPPPPGCGAVVERVLLVVVRERQQRLFAPRRSREAVGHRQVGFRGARTARAVGRETERGLGRVRRSRADLEQQGAALSWPCRASPGRVPVARARGRLRRAPGSRAGRRAGNRGLRGYAPRRAGPSRAPVAGARARPRGATAARSQGRRGARGLAWPPARAGTRDRGGRKRPQLPLARPERNTACRARAGPSARLPDTPPPCARGPRSPCPSARRRPGAAPPSAGRRTPRRCPARRRRRAPRPQPAGSWRRASYAREVASRAWSRSRVLSMSEWVSWASASCGRPASSHSSPAARRASPPAGVAARRSATAPSATAALALVAASRTAASAASRGSAASRQPGSPPAWAPPAAAGRRRSRPRRGPYWDPRAAASPPARIRTSSSWK